jgi:hypothetical protein
VEEPYPSVLVGVARPSVALFGMWRLSCAVATALALLLVLSTVGIAISQLRAYTPPITNASDNGLAGSIASMEQVRLGDVDQWVSDPRAERRQPGAAELSGGPGGR